ncbi:hypothetical protein BKA56DRAFT_612727 [Ilyonectria sp. MPI-CAGE-AT-0026]|nr:hypothetical protein BKA56DRAFT_612727 [Ilyonectria sp. MPI-CAGE-AT-0026]
MVWCVCLLRAEPSPLFCSTAATPASCSCKRSCGGSSRHTPYANAFAIEWVRICKVQGAWRMADGGWRMMSLVQQDRCATMRYAHTVIVMRGAIRSPMHAVSPLSSGFVADIESRALLNIETLIDGQYLQYGRVCSIPSSRPCQASYHANGTQASSSRLRQISEAQRIENPPTRWTERDEMRGATIEIPVQPPSLPEGFRRDSCPLVPEPPAKGNREERGSLTEESGQMPARDSHRWFALG